MEKDILYHGDCIEKMRLLPPESIDVVFADPPYNLQLNNDLKRPDHSKVDAVRDSWDQFQSFQDYDQFTEKWLTEARRVLKKNGTIWVMGSYHNVFRLGTRLQDLDFWILNDVIWTKNNPMPNFKGTRFTNAHETLIWCSKHQKSRYTFNYASMKELNDGLQMRSDWMLPICNGKERLKTSEGKKVHSTQKPESLLYRVILASTNPGDVILDPFFGTGTTGVVAKKTGRHFIGIEANEFYLAYAQNRLEGTEFYSHDRGLLNAPNKKTQPRVSFGSVVEQGYLSVGDVLFDARGISKARVCADGALMAEGHRGSIHKVAAALEGSESCNGWTYWHIQKDPKKYVSIDAFRQEIRQKILNV